MMRRKIRDRLRNPDHRSYNYKYEQEMSFMLPYFREATSNAEEYDFDFADAQEVDLSAEVFSNQENYNQTENRDVKPNVSYGKKAENFNSGNDYQELNPKDPIDVFLITIGSTLRKFSPYYLNHAKSKIFQVVQDYELQQIVDKEQPSTSDTNLVNR